MVTSRRQLADRATELAGGARGVTQTSDPDGHFRLVTEGRQDAQEVYQRSWDRADPAKRAAKRPSSYSSCEDLATRICFEACDGKPGMRWCNRVDAGNTWQPGQNLLRIKREAPYAWHDWRAGGRWLAQLGDPVQVQNSYGAHTLVLTEIRYDADGLPTSVDIAQYGQVLDPDGAGPAPSDNGGNCRTSVPVHRDSLRRWCVGSAYVIGHVDVMAIVEHEIGGAATQPAAPPPPPSRPEQPTLSEPIPGARVLRLGSRGGDVAALQRLVAMPGGSYDGAYGPRTLAAVQAWQQAHGLLPDGVVGRATWTALGVRWSG